jgi:hypothetical protein
MGFASGFRAGYDVVSAAEERRRKEELRQGLQRESARFTPTEVASGEEALRGFREGTAQTDTFTIPNADGSGGLTVTPAQYEQMYLSDLQQRPAGYMVEQAVVPELGGRQYETLAAAEQAVAPSRAAGLANVYRQAGDVAEAEQLMGLSRGAQLQNLQIGAAQRSEEDALKVQTATEEIAALGRPPTLEEVRQIASANRLSLDQQFKLGENVTGIASQDAKMLEEDIKKKIKGKGLDALIKIHKDDPAFDDNSFFEKSVGEDGKITLTEKSNDGAIISTQSFPNAAAATKYLNQAAVDPANLYTWLQTSRLNEAKLAESTAGIASSEERRKLAEAQRLGLPAAAQIDAQRQNIALADQFRKQIADANKLLENYAEGTPQHNAVLAQRNSAARALTDVNRLLQPGGLTRSKTQPVAPDFDEAGRKAALDAASSGINPVTKKPFTKADKEKFEEYFGVKFPESAPAQSLKPASPRAARAARPDTIPPAPPQTITTRGGVTRDNPEYLEWERKYGTPSGLR